jgi:hypothetical protein
VCLGLSHKAHLYENRALGKHVFANDRYNQGAMIEISSSPLIFNLHWLRETDADLGTTLTPDELESAVRARVLKATEGALGEFRLRLPYLDRRELRRKTEVLGPIPFVRRGTEIVPVLKPRLALRTLAAELVLTNPAWLAAPTGRHRNRFRVWQRVSHSLQRSLRRWIFDAYFHDLRACEDRETSHTVIIYGAARINRCHAPYDFTYDLLDFPARLDTLEVAWRYIGTSIRRLLIGLESRLIAGGRTELAEKYSPRFYEDILRDVRSRPRTFAEIIASESKLIDGIIELGASRTAAEMCAFADSANLALRKVAGLDLRDLAQRALHTTTALLEEMKEEGLFAAH